MGSPGVVKADPLSDDTRHVLLCFEAMTMSSLLLQRSDDAFDHPARLREVRRDNFWSKAVASHHQGAVLDVTTRP